MSCKLKEIHFFQLRVVPYSQLIISEFSVVPLFLWNICSENDFDLLKNKPAGGTHFHMKGFALRFVLKQRYKRTQKWPVQFFS